VSELEISKESLKRVDIIRVNGRIDSNSAPEFDNELKATIENGRFNIALNLANVNYMSSAGLRALISALRESKKRSGNVVLAAPSDRVKEVLELAGLTSIFNIYDDETAAVGSF
jgi:anti-sigma B factor antagonist